MNGPTTVSRPMKVLVDARVESGRAGGLQQALIRAGHRAREQ